MKVSTRLVGLVAGVGLVSLAALGFLADRGSGRALLEQQSRSLAAVRQSRQRFVEYYFKVVRGQVDNMARSDMFSEALERVAVAFHDLPRELDGPRAEDWEADLGRYYEVEERPRVEAAGLPWPGLEARLPQSRAGRLAQAMYLGRNPHPIGQKDRLDGAGVDCAYDRLHAHYHPLLRSYRDSFGYYDMFLFDSRGFAIYTVAKEVDFGSDFTQRPWRNTSLGGLLRRVHEAAPGTVMLVDHTAYDPSYGVPASFIAAPVFHDGKPVGVLAFQMGMEELNRIVGDRAGLGESGETYLVGSDLKMRSDSRLVAGSEIGVRPAETAAARAAIAGDEGVMVDRDFRGVETLVSYGPVEIGDYRWALLAQIDMAEVVAPATRLRRQIVGFGVVAACAALLLILIFLRRVVIDPVSRLVAGTRRLAAGDFAHGVEVHSRDEFGELAAAFNRMVESISDQLEARRRTETALRDATEEAEAANKAKSTFLAVMSHEIRTPMNAIINMTRLALDTELTAKQRQYLTTVSSSGQALLSLINDILDFSKIEAERLELEQAPFRLRGVLDEITETFRARVIEKHVELVTHVERDVPDGLVGDALRLRQVLTNLLGNAFKFTSAGEIVLRVALAGGPTGSDGGVVLRVGVRDTGIGIPREKQGGLFQPFAQADSSTTRKYGGTGLGLVISRRLVRLMGGDLSLESEPGKGTEFWFTARFELDPSADQGEDPVPEEVRALHALVVEDTASSRALIEGLLARFGVGFTSVATAEEALELVTAATTTPVWNVVLLDWVLPGMDGITAAERIRGTPGREHLPIVLMSAFAGAEEEARAEAVGISAFLPKPITASSLLDTIMSVTGLGHLERPERRHGVATDTGGLRGARILLAEDNEANRFVAEEILGAAGIELEVAVDGAEAVAMVEAGATSYDAVLMDMQMPVMDGLEATRRIRAFLAGRRLPIVAMTANAMKSDVDACLAAGMDDYLAKPIDREVLFRTLMKWIALRSGAPAAAAVAAPVETDLAPPELAGVDIEGGLRRLGLSWPAFRRLLVRFAPGTRTLLEELRRAIGAADREAAHRHAHSIAGSAGNVSADRLRELARALEHEVKAGGGETARLLAAVEEEANRVIDAIEALAAVAADAAPAVAPARTATAAPDPAALVARLRALEQALAESDLGAVSEGLDGVRALATPSGLGSDLGRLVRLIDDYEYDDAAVLVRTLIERAGRRS